MTEEQQQPKPEWNFQTHGPLPKELEGQYTVVGGPAGDGAVTEAEAAQGTDSQMQTTPNPPSGDRISTPDPNAPYMGGGSTEGQVANPQGTVLVSNFEGSDSGAAITTTDSADGGSGNGQTTGDGPAEYGGAELSGDDQSVPSSSDGPTSSTGTAASAGQQG